MTTAMTNESREASSGDIFIDPGFSPAEAELHARSIEEAHCAHLHQRGWTQAELGAAIESAQSEVSLLVNGASAASRWTGCWRHFKPSG